MISAKIEVDNNSQNGKERNFIMKNCGQVLIQVADIRVQKQEISTKESISCVISVGQQSKRAHPFREMRCALSFTKTREETVNIDCKYDLEEISEHIGDTDIPLEPVLWNLKHSEWYTLLDRGKPTGQVYVKMQFRPYAIAEHNPLLSPSTYPPQSQLFENPFNPNYQYFPP